MYFKESTKRVNLTLTKYFKLYLDENIFDDFFPF